MSKTLDTFRLSLCFFSGEDDFIIRKCSKKIQIAFAFIGTFVIIIFLGCFISAFEFAISVFNESLLPVIPFIIALVWAFLVSNLYLLLLYTISPMLLPVSKKRKTNRSGKTMSQDESLSISLILRITLITLLAIVIAQPLSVFHLSGSIDKQLQNHKDFERALMIISFDSTSITNEAKLANNFKERLTVFKSEYPYVIKQSERIFNKQQSDFYKLAQIKQIQDSLSREKKVTLSETKYEKRKDSLQQVLISISNELIDSDNRIVNSIDNIEITSVNLKADYLNFRNEFKSIIQQRILNHDRILKAIEESNYYTTKIKLLLRNNPVSWLLTIIICFIFILPIYLKYVLRNISKNFFNEDFKGQHTMYRMREEMLNTKDFTWLKRNLLKADLNGIVTSDFYFQKMLIEYRIILEDYEEFKQNHSKLLKEKIESFNRNSLDRLNTKLEQLKKINTEKHSVIFCEIRAEFIANTESFEKYEYWEDAPFRTLKKSIQTNLKNDEEELLQLLYSNPDNNEIL